MTKLQAIKASIKHWKANLKAHQQRDAGITAVDCPLCYKFLKREVHWKSPEANCPRCPLTLHSRNWWCEYQRSPWRQCQYQWNHGEFGLAWRSACRRMIRCLEACLKDCEKKKGGK